MAIERYYLIGEEIKYFNTIEDAEKEFDGFKKKAINGGWKALGVEYINPTSNFNPCCVDLLISVNGEEKVSNDYKYMGCEEILEPEVQKLRKIRK